MLRRGDVRGSRTGRAGDPVLQRRVQQGRGDVERFKGVIDLKVRRLAGLEATLEIGQLAVHLLPLPGEHLPHQRGKVAGRALVSHNPAASRDRSGQFGIDGARVHGRPALFEKSFVLLEAGRRAQEKVTAIRSVDHDAMPVHAGCPDTQLEFVTLEPLEARPVAPGDRHLRAQRRLTIARDIQPAERRRGHQCEASESKTRAAPIAQGELERQSREQRPADQTGQQQWRQALETDLPHKPPAGAGAHQQGRHCNLQGNLKGGIRLRAGQRRLRRGESGIAHRRGRRCGDSNGHRARQRARQQHDCEQHPDQANGDDRGAEPR